MKQGNFSVNKSSVPFTSIGADHGIGGIKGITNNQWALDECFLTAGRMGTIIEEFAELFQIEENMSHKKDQYYQVTGSKNKRISVNVNKLTVVTRAFGVGVGNSTNLFNIYIKKVMPAKFLTLEEIGQERYHKFLEEQLSGEKSIWDQSQKKSFRHLLSSTNELLEKKLMSWFMFSLWHWSTLLFCNIRIFCGFAFVIHQEWLSSPN